MCVRACACEYVCLRVYLRVYLCGYVHVRVNVCVCVDAGVCVWSMHLTDSLKFYELNESSNHHDFNE